MNQLAKSATEEEKDSKNFQLGGRDEKAIINILQCRLVS